MVEEQFRGSGAGGQHRNKTDSCIRLTHPSGVQVVATEQRSQHQNRRVAWERLRKRLGEQALAESHESVNQDRSDQMSGKRDWSWTQWRDEVKGPGKIKGCMSRCLSGKLDKLVR